jgi:phenylacetic acid degradation operon negative regulatory protein
MSQDRLHTVCNALVGRFRRQRPLRAGSLLVTIFGDSLWPRGGAVTLGSLIRLAAPFGIAERLVRTSVARLAGEGWLENRRVGRLSEYRPTGAGRQRFATATGRVYGETPHRWSGRWTLVVLPSAMPRERERVRQQLAWSGYGEPRPGLFAHPFLTVAQAREQLDGLPGADQLYVFEAATGRPDEDRRIASAGWDLDELAARYRRFMRQFAPIHAALGGRVAPAPETAFTIRTLLIHEYRKIQLRDPLLPDSLLPPDWVGAEAHVLSRDLYTRLFPAAEQHLDAIGACLAGPLPPPEPETFRRFGGLPRR